MPPVQGLKSIKLADGKPENVEVTDVTDEVGSLVHLKTDQDISSTNSNSQNVDNEKDGKQAGDNTATKDSKDRKEKETKDCQEDKDRKDNKEQQENGEGDDDEQPSMARKRSQHQQKGEFYQCDYRCSTLTVFVIGASGDLAKKKTYPALLSLYQSNYLPEDFNIVGYARSKISDDDFRSKMRGYLTKGGEGDGEADEGDNRVDKFLKRCIYRNGESYDDEEAMKKIVEEISELEGESGADVNRLFYFAVPPSVFVSVAKVLKNVASGHSGWSRFILEKPFGHDLESFKELNEEISSTLDEEQIFRIDHYIGKEAVQNLLVMRFANAIFEPLWNRQYVSSVIISFKENFGTEGRGGYFDKTGIIRDVMQNHLVQVLTMFGMEAPVHQSGNYIRDEKVKVLKAMREVRVEDCITGQYIEDDEGKMPGYTADDGVPDDSKTPTFAAMVMYIDNPRWDGVPFIMRAGKALNERKSEVRMQFKRVPGASMLFPDMGSEGHEKAVERNELVMRLQPNEAVYLKMNIKSPGLAGDPTLSELDLSYRLRYPDKFSKLPDAYTRLILQVLRGDKSAFVRDDELREAWRIFTPLLHSIDDGAIEPIKYKAYSRGPKEFDDLSKNHGYVYAGKAYQWHREDKPVENGK